MRERSIYFCVLSCESNTHLLPKVEEQRCGSTKWGAGQAVGGAGPIPEVKKPPRLPQNSRCAPQRTRVSSAGLRFYWGHFHVFIWSKTWRYFFLPLVMGWFCNPSLVASVVCGVPCFLVKFWSWENDWKNEVVGDGGLFWFVFFVLVLRKTNTFSGFPFSLSFASADKYSVEKVKLTVFCIIELCWTGADFLHGKLGLPIFLKDLTFLYLARERSLRLCG